MPTERKGWDSLSSAYKKRLQSNGITKAEYSKGASIAGARGHAATPEHGGYKKIAGRLGIAEYIPEFFDLERAEQEEIGQDWVTGFMSRGKGDVVNPRRRKGERIKRRASDEQIKARQRFMRFMDETEGGMTKENWAAFRVEYVRNFSA